MSFTDVLLCIIVALLAMIDWKIGKIDARSRERFPTEKEADYDWSQKDPMGHYEAHKDDKK